MHDRSLTWKPGWPDRIQNEVRLLGHKDLSSLLDAEPGRTYKDIGDMLGGFAPAQIVRVQYQEALKANKPRAAAMDALAREIRWHLPEGWGLGEKPDRGRISALGAWATSLAVQGVLPENDDTWLKVARALESLSPPQGWKPCGPEDPLIVAAFEKGWPEKK